VRKWDDSMSVGLLAALVGGVLTLLSPCSVMLLPAFFSYAFTSPSALLSRTGVFYLGLISTLVPLGMLAGTAGAFINQNRMLLVTAASIIVILLGLVMLLGLPIPSFSRSSSADNTSVVAVYALGTVYGLAGVCAGPLLGAVLTVAALSGNALRGGITLFVFAAGMTLPLLVLSILWSRVPAIRRLVRPRELSIGRWRTTWTTVIGGALTIGVGVLLLATGGTASVGGVLSASDQAAVESDVSQMTSSVPDVVFAAGALGVFVLVLLFVHLRHNRRRDQITRKETLNARF
jgi:cytochrome c-type biogenesis protein